MEGAAAIRRLVPVFALALVLLGREMSGCHGVPLVPRAPANVLFVRKSCTATAYPQLCFRSLSAYASKIQTSPVQLADTALSLALASARSASTVLTRTSAAGGMTPRDAAAVRDCMELMEESVEELQQSLEVMGHLGGQNLGLQISDMQTWVSAALTDDDTCVDGFQGGNADDRVKNMVRSHVVNVAQMTSNALALINGLVSTHSTTP